MSETIVASPTPAKLAAEVIAEAGRRRTFAVISHPDAGKSTLTEALALHAQVITEAGAVHGKGSRRGVTSDWMSMEKDRGISITSAVLQFSYGDAVVNLLDTPGHADFSEDTYRVLAAVDAAVMLLDAAKGLEPQTLKLFAVCKDRGVPIITFVNKWDRPGREPFELLDEIEQAIGLRPTPLTWPVGIAGDFRGVVDRRAGHYIRFTRTAGGASAAPEEVMTSERAAAKEGASWTAAQDELGLLDAIEADFDPVSYRAGTSTPVLFGSALSNFGVKLLLDTLLELAPAPEARLDDEGDPRRIDDEFSGFVFKVQANMDRAHRDRIAFVRVCSGRFERGMVATHAESGKPFATKYAHAAFGQQRTTLDVAFPGDVVGLVNTGALRVGDTLYQGRPVRFPPIPSFAPEHFAAVRAKDFGRFKQFRRGVAQLAEEGVVQVLRSDFRGEATPVLAAVGPMQFEVVTHRLAEEFGAEAVLDQLGYSIAMRTDEASALTLRTISGIEVLSRVVDDALLVLFPDKWRLAWVQRQHPDVLLEPLVASTS